MQGWREIQFRKSHSTARDRRSVSVFLFEVEHGSNLRSRSRFLVETLLSSYDPRARLYKDARGKPRVRGCDLHVSIAHSGPCLVVAIGDVDLGVDIEYLRYPSMWRPTYGWINKASDQLASPDEHDFLECWTAKESLVKLIGVGLDFGLQRLSVPSARSAAWRMASAGKERYWLKPLPRWNAMVVSLAVERPGAVQTFRVVDFDRYVDHAHEEGSS
jgi:phosphopantetheinyl transferase